MTETTEQDPSIEEILASIRQIISDDDEVDGETEAEVAVEEPAVEEPMDEVEDVDLGSDDDDDSDEVFELTQDMKESAVSSAADGLDVKFQDQLEDESYDIDSGLVEDEQDSAIFTDTAASVTVDSFKKLSEKVALSSYSDNITLEEIVKDMLRPMLREWIDSNMPQLVEVLVEKELEKLARHAKDS